MEKQIQIFWIAGIFLPAINETVFTYPNIEHPLWTFPNEFMSCYILQYIITIFCPIVSFLVEFKLNSNLRLYLDKISKLDSHQLV